jgi:hypothetical protein
MLIDFLRTLVSNNNTIIIIIIIIIIVNSVVGNAFTVLVGVQ